MWYRFWEEQGIANKLSVFVKGPGWRAGKPRLGDPADIPTVKMIIIIIILLIIIIMIIIIIIIIIIITSVARKLQSS